MNTCKRAKKLSLFWAFPYGPGHTLQSFYKPKSKGLQKGFPLLSLTQKILSVCVFILLYLKIAKQNKPL
jgi:hypothetical protein